jgi:hypothetical protein
MKTFTPKEKMSKKDQQELNKAQRNIWQLSPITRRAESKKVYNRKKIRLDRNDLYQAGSFFCYSH